MSATKLETEDAYRSSAYVDYARIYSEKYIVPCEDTKNYRISRIRIRLLHTKIQKKKKYSEFCFRVLKLTNLRI